VITGESLGQVASQTLENLTAVDAVATLTVLRPLIGFDKSEIITEAKKFGTYDISIRPAVDCCTLFADRHPAIRANDQILEEQEKRFSVDEFVESALTSIERRDYSR
jgi:thiamine biosynthesis protein ThiI